MEKKELTSSYIISILNADPNTAAFIKKYSFQNLLNRSGELIDRFLDPSGNVVAGLPGHNTAAGFIAVEAGQRLYLHKITTTDYDQAIRYAFYDSSDGFISRSANYNNYFELNIPSNAARLRVSYPATSQPRVERKV